MVPSDYLYLIRQLQQSQGKMCSIGQSHIRYLLKAHQVASDNVSWRPFIATFICFVLYITKVVAAWIMMKWSNAHYIVRKGVTVPGRPVIVDIKSPECLVSHKKKKY